MSLNFFQLFALPIVEAISLAGIAWGAKITRSNLLFFTEKKGFVTDPWSIVQQLNSSLDGFLKARIAFSALILPILLTALFLTAKDFYEYIYQDLKKLNDNSPIFSAVSFTDAQALAGLAFVSVFAVYSSYGLRHEIIREENQKNITLDYIARFSNRDTEFDLEYKHGILTKELTANIGQPEAASIVGGSKLSHNQGPLFIQGENMPFHEDETVDQMIQKAKRRGDKRTLEAALNLKKQIETPLTPAEFDKRLKAAGIERYLANYKKAMKGTSSS